jgi:hypothetical protein
VAETFLRLSAKDRSDALGVASSRTGRPIHILEKDTWVVWTLATLFDAHFAAHLVFKGGTSLSKAYKAIRRFSEDIDITYDIRILLPELTKEAGVEAMPASKGVGRKWSEAVNDQLPIWVAETALPHVQHRITDSELPATARAEADCLHIEYESVASGYGYVAPRIRVEFGARSTGEPADVKDITCDAADGVPQLSFPTASPRVMRVERTFWEKATAIHVFCHKDGLKDRLARHWYDVAMLDTAGLAKSAIVNRDIAQAVARHKNIFFSTTDSKNRPIDYQAAVSGALVLVPEGATLESLRSDYNKMIEDGLFLDQPETFENIIERCRGIQTRANAAAAPLPSS